ncbi:type II toxin-antitoxin system death-on-curing family toxin [Williamsoniiplasma lucivorax]|uniref:Fido domain-containing protein n=1 Tax=Williamsoniiplasma lucivorax TaxID=209274 RepID=A0A2S5RD81_9MOLU|nr:type II toxin-antitoxin system death-on-curing family toxin [Williamsoniiplasma lucivorax]PPE05257.1 hypothetical protein ELUCI_v1c07930 [Williamsoniiplasma lucivorax]
MKTYKWIIANDKDIQLFRECLVKTPYLDFMNPKDFDKLWSKDYIPILIHKTAKIDIKIQPKIYQLVFNEELANGLTKFCINANKFAPLFGSPNSSYFEKQKGEASATISSLVQKWSYHPNLSILDVAAELMYDLATKHKFADGNKRTALITTLFFLKACGLYLLKQNPNDWDEFTAGIVVDHSSGVDGETLKERIRNALKNGITISFKWGE